MHLPFRRCRFLIEPRGHLSDHITAERLDGIGRVEMRQISGFGDRQWSPLGGDAPDFQMGDVPPF